MEKSQISDFIFEHSCIPVALIEMREDFHDGECILSNEAAKQALPLLASRKEGGQREVSREHNDLWRCLLAKFKDANKEETGREVSIDLYDPMKHRNYVVQVLPVSDRVFAWIFLDVTEQILLRQEIQQRESELKKLIEAHREQLESALATKSRYIAAASHELRTPLTGISCALDLLAKSSLNEEQKRLVTMAGASCQQLMLVANDVLDDTRLREGKVELFPENTNLRALVQVALEVMTMEAHRKNVELICDIAPEAPEEILADTIRMRQVFVNLLSNAIKFSHIKNVAQRAEAQATDADGNLRAVQRPAVTIGLRVDNLGTKAQLVFFVRDTGVGLSEKTRESLFKPFSQLDSPEKRQHSGSGLGLSICKQLVELMGGKIWFESQPWAGTTFFFTIGPPTIFVTQEQAPRLPSHCKSSMNALVVSDCRHLLEFLGRSLQREGMSVDDCMSVDSATKHLSSHRQKTYVVAVVDMDTLGAGEFVRNLQDIGIPIVQLCNILPSPGSITKTTASSCIVYKPVQRDNLLNSVRDYLEAPGAAPCNCKKQPRPEPLPIFTSLRILVVDDNAMNLELFRRTVKSLGCQVETAKSGAIALEACRKNFFDIVLMDIMMPEMDGIETTDRLHAELPLSQQPAVVAFTASASPADRKAYMDHGICEVITKPIDIARLRTVFETIARTKKLAQR